MAQENNLLRIGGKNIFIVGAGTAPISEINGQCHKILNQSGIAADEIHTVIVGLAPSVNCLFDWSSLDFANVERTVILTPDESGGVKAVVYAQRALLVEDDYHFALAIELGKTRANIVILKKTGYLDQHWPPDGIICSLLEGATNRVMVQATLKKANAILAGQREPSILKDDIHYFSAFQDFCQAVETGQLYKREIAMIVCPGKTPSSILIRL